MTRAELDALIDTAVTATVAAVDPDSDDAASAREEAQLLEAEARSFADAVDRDGKRIPYAEAVMLEGERGVSVVDARTFDEAPLYWRTVVGRPDAVIRGDELIPALQAAAGRIPPG